jgi:hypothetical protein
VNWSHQPPDGHAQLSCACLPFPFRPHFAYNTNLSAFSGAQMMVALSTPENQMRSTNESSLFQTHQYKENKLWLE